MNLEFAANLQQIENKCDNTADYLTIVKSLNPHHYFVNTVNNYISQFRFVQIAYKIEAF